ncbi:plasmid mobilization protein, partial [Faecalimonas sp. LCP19S3_D12]
MSENHRYRKRTFKVYLFDEELQLLNDKANALGMTKSAYIRDLILFGQARKADDKNYEKVIYELNKIGSNINQLAYIANAEFSTNGIEVLSLLYPFLSLRSGTKRNENVSLSLFFLYNSSCRELGIL